MKKESKNKVPIVFLVIIISGIVVSLLAIILKLFYPVKDIHQDFPRLGVSLNVSSPQPSDLGFPSFDSLPKSEIVNGKIIYSAGGSSSCPPSVKSGFMKNDGTITLKIADYPGRACTADYRVFSQEISLPDGKTFPDNAVIKILH